MRKKTITIIKTFSTLVLEYKYVSSIALDVSDEYDQKSVVVVKSDRAGMWGGIWGFLKTAIRSEHG